VFRAARRADEHLVGHVGGHHRLAGADHGADAGGVVRLRREAAGHLLGPLHLLRVGVRRRDPAQPAA
jgi:hypothetical protein